ncbi:MULTISPECIES: ABC transporter ATP-binding protein [Tissierellales]|jgi:putative ABC transport system ATP-binding protein|uniref:ABC transporter ATP-binding protein n=1 Tax=Acidilutibacter cellobiosedens TaxID=2507161 RepID=A0A410QEG0_9FIRM|nr:MULTISPECIES: ABC transporter ATP-binding protein [Tissierellales]QAT62309.1 ABC transporter ATP-binding protein [Acidilutibacter cellobiosedens]SCL92188.1 Bacitracin export ATP-binding protein BceA [Sporanaerobacter sp. PP17-6a]
MKILETKSLKKYYGKGESLVKALDGVDLSVEEGEFVAIVGSSGSGKTTLLHMMGGLDRLTSGRVFIDGKDIYSMDNESLTIFRRRKIGFVFQSYNLIPVLNVWENIILPIEFDLKVVDEEFIKEIMRTLNIIGKKDAFPNELSGGQQQRVAIARALATRPSIVLADEPTGNLDSKTSLEVLNLLKQSIKKYHQTLVMITHDERLAQMSDRIVRIEDGKLINEE